MGKVQIVTGAGSGLGKSTAKLMSKYGPVLICGRTESKLDATVKEIKALGREAEYMVVDVTDLERVKDFCKEAVSMGEIGNVIHAAGVAPHHEKAHDVMEIDLRGTINVVETFYPVLQKGSVMVCFASMAAHLGIAGLLNKDEKRALFDNPYREDLSDYILNGLGFSDNAGVAYSIAKLFVIEYVKRNVLRFAQKGARIVSISPGTFRTPMNVDDSGRIHDEVEEIVKNTPAGHLGDPDDAAELVDYLCGEKGTFFFGTDILIDGGYAAAFTLGKKQL